MVVTALYWNKIMEANMDVKVNVLTYRGFEIDIQAIDDYGAYYNTACLEVDVSGRIGDEYYYTSRYEVDNIEQAIKWIDKTYEEHLQKYPIENS